MLLLAVNCVPLAVGKYADRCPAVARVKREQGDPARRDIFQDKPAGLEVVDFVPLREVKEFEAVAVVPDPPSFFCICQFHI